MGNGPLGTDTNAPSIDSGTNALRRNAAPADHIPVSDPVQPPRGPSISALVAEPLSPEEMWEQAVQSQRGFQSSPSGPADSTRSKPATIAIDPKGGPKTGKGYETFASIQIIDKDGKRVAIGADYYHGGGDDHAEVKVMKALEKNAPEDLDGARLIVVVEQDPCPKCAPALEEFARKRGATMLEVHVPTAESLTKPGHAVKPKTAATTSLQGRRTVTLKKITSLELPARPRKSPGMPRGGGPTGPSTKVILGATALNLAGGIALNIFNDRFKSYMLEEVAKMPRPQMDRRKAADYLADPSSRKAIQILDLLNKNLPAFISELNENHQSVIGGTHAQLALLALSRADKQKTAVHLDPLCEELEQYRDKLLTVEDNTRAALELEQSAIEKAVAAEELLKIVEHGLVVDQLIKMGFTLEEVMKIWDNLRHFAASVRKTFRDFNELGKLLERLVGDTEKLINAVTAVMKQNARDGSR